MINFYHLYLDFSSSDVLISTKRMVLCALRKIQTSVSMFKRGWGAGGAEQDAGGQDVVFKELKVFSLEKRRYREKIKSLL